MTVKNTKWEKIPETENVRGMKILIFVVKILGYRIANYLLYFIAMYYVLANRISRDASYEYLKNLHRTFPDSHPYPRFKHVYMHHLSFARTLLERVLLWIKNPGQFHFDEDGKDIIENAVSRKKGFILIGAHIGSFDALRVLTKDLDISVNVVMYSANSKGVVNLIKSLNPAFSINIISLDEDRISAIMKLKELVSGGQMVAFVADRTPPDDARKRTVKVPFLGKDAVFSLNPWILAGMLECEVALYAAQRTGKMQYHCYARRFMKHVNIDRDKREENLKEVIKKYVRFLEEMCKREPYQWFNFFNFWQ